MLAAAVPYGQGWRQVGDVGAAFALSALVGVEREFRQKSAGLRTHTLVGLGAALFVLLSKYGFVDVLQPGRIVVDPARVAAQIVTGIGFLGAGLIFVQRGSVRGLTTAAAVWVTAAIGAAAGAGLLILAALVTGGYFVVALVFAPLDRRIPRAAGAVSIVHVRYRQGQGLLREVLRVSTEMGFVVDHVSTESVDADHPSEGPVAASGPLVKVAIHLHGPGSLAQLAAALDEVDGVDGVRAGEPPAGLD